MARATRIVLDLALVSLRTVRPAVSKIWSTAKTAIVSTPVRPLVSNPVVRTVETALDRVTDTLVSKITELRDRQLPGEMKYLENELEKVRRKMGGDGDSSTSKAIKPALSTAWQYAKVEVAPPTTLGYINGPAGQKIEDSVSKAADNFIAGLEGRIRDIDAEEQRKIKEKEAEIMAAQEKAKAEAKKKEEERKRQDAKKVAKEAKKVEAKAEKSKDEPKDKKKEEPKAKTKEQPKKETKTDSKKK